MIEAHGLVKRYGSTLAVSGEGISFTAFFAGQALISGHAPPRRSAIPG